MKVAKDGIITAPKELWNNIKSLNDALTVLKTIDLSNNSINDLQSTVVSNNVLSDDEEKIFNLESQISNGNYPKALALIDSYGSTDNYFKVMKIKLKYLSGNIPYNSISKEDKAVLEDVIANGKGDGINTAMDILSIANKSSRMSFAKADYVAIPYSEKWLSIHNPHINVFPNPTNDIISVEIVNSKSSTSKIEICNVIGEPIQSKQTSLSAGILRFDVSGLASGVYLVNVYSDNKTIPLKAKFVKN